MLSWSYLFFSSPKFNHKLIIVFITLGRTAFNMSEGNIVFLKCQNQIDWFMLKTILESMLKSRGVRKNKYKDDLKRVHEFLCVKVQDYDNLKKKYKELEANYARLQKKNSELSDNNISKKVLGWCLEKKLIDWPKGVLKFRTPKDHLMILFHDKTKKSRRKK